MSKTLKVAVIGVGGIARVHMPGWAASEHAEVVAGCDINEAVLQRWGEEHNVEKLTTDAAELFGDPDIDVWKLASTCCARNRWRQPRPISGI
jgi:predicted dehydrogenase